VKIKEIRALGLHGATPEGGWSAELRAEDCVSDAPGLGIRLEPDAVERYSGRRLTA
jgi:hypothetical protein